jgi:hypothetical protein
MEEIIIKHLNKQYQLTLSTYVSYKVLDKIDNVEVSLKQVIQNIILIFNIDETEIMGIFDKWADNQATLLNNKIADIRYKLYEQTGVELQLTTNDLNQLVTSKYPNIDAVIQGYYDKANNEQ